MQRIGLWHITPEGPRKLPASNVDLERHLEAWIEKDPGMLQNGLVIVGRQVQVEGGIVDLLALDTQGGWSVIEIKRGSVGRETIAQALDYASCIATVPYEALQAKVNPYLSRQATGSPVTLEDLLRQRQAEEEPGSQAREVSMIVVGVGTAPGLERMVRYLFDQCDVPIQVISFGAFAAPDGQHLLVRELTESETPAQATTRYQVVSLEAICAFADRCGTGAIMQTLLEAAQQHGLYPHPWKHSLMFAPPRNHSRALFTIWPDRKDGQSASVWVGPRAFAEFFPVSEEQALQLLGPEGFRQMTLADAQAFTEGMDQLLRSPQENDQED